MKKIYSICLILFCTYKISYGQQQNRPPQVITIDATVKNDQGNPILGAKIYGREGSVIVKTNPEGNFSISVPSGSEFLVESEGYESRVLSEDEIRNGVILKATPFLFGENDNVKIAFGSIKKGTLTGDVSVIEPRKFANFDNTQYVPDAITGRVAGLFGANNIRGLGDALVVLDGIPRYSKLTDVNLNMEEIDQITVLKDVSAVALYGSQARNGVIIITTKRGKPNKRDINVSVYSGISTPRALPQYLNSSDYMTLYNEALRNDGLPIKYDATTIENYKSGNPYRYPSTDYYGSNYLKSSKSFSKVIAEFSGGNDNSTFYANIGWTRDGSLLNFGNGLNAESNRFNARANVDFKINSFIKSNLDIAGVFDFNKGPNGDFYAEASTMRPNFFTPLIPLDLISKSNPSLTNLINGRKNDVDGLYILGGTQQNTTNAIASSYAGGVNQPVRRTLQFNNGIDVDLGKIVKGLKARTNISFDYYNSYNQTISNLYSVYEPTWSAKGDSIISLSQYGIDSRPGTQNVNNADFLRRIGIFGQLDYNATFSNVHNVNATVLGFFNSLKAKGILQPELSSHIGLRLGYNFDNTYFIDFSGAFVNSIKLPVGSRGGFSPTLAFAWDISKANFLKDSRFINYLKLKASGGVINTDINHFGINFNSITNPPTQNGFYLYDNPYSYNSSSGSYTWADGTFNNITNSLYGANPNLTFEKRKEINLGLEGSLFNRSVNVDINYFKTRISDKFGRPNIAFPGSYSSFLPYSNTGIDEYSGLTVGLGFVKKWGDFGIDVGANAMFWSSEVIERDELFADAYQYRKGRPTDAIFGLESEGFFTSKDDIKGRAFQAFGEVRPGDIKYKDQNKDGVIDDNDQVMIGRGLPTTVLGINVKVTYKNFSLFMIGNSNMGSNFLTTNNYYWVDGDKKYSNQVLNRWTEATASTATYPRLTSKTSTNNFRNSTFWKYSNDIFNISRVQLTFDVPEQICKKVYMKKLSVFVNGSNLASFSSNTDILNLNVGTEPQFRSYSLGLRTMF
jgi:TonB-linked SusC/RagA family outer membrane protein